MVQDFMAFRGLLEKKPDVQSFGFCFKMPSGSNQVLLCFKNYVHPCYTILREYDPFD